MKAQILAALLCGLLCVGAPANADAVQQACQLYFKESTDRSADVGSLMDQYRDIASRVCVDTSGTIQSYYSVTATWADRFSVCQYQQVKRDATRAGRSADSTYLISSYMYLSRSDCPRQNSSNYIETIGISGGLFSALVQFWDGLASSKSRFDAAFSRVEVDDLSKVTLMELENLLFVRGTRPKLLRIVHRPAERGLLNAGYELSIQSTEPSALTTLYVDITPDGFKVLSIGLVVT